MNSSPFQLLQERLENHQISVEAVVVQAPEPGLAGRRLILDPEGNCLAGEGPPRLLELLGEGARGLSRRRRQDLLQESGFEVYLERWAPAPRLVLFGGGHVGRALCGVLAPLEVRIQVVEDRSFFADPARFPGNVLCHCGPMDQAAEVLGVGPEDLVVIATRGHSEDLTCLRSLLPRRPRYLGLLGSRRKMREFRRLLLEEGVPEADLDAVRSPVGLSIGAQTPEEIGISIAAELIALLSGQAAEG